MVAELLKDRLKYFPKNQALLSFLNNKLWFFFFSLPTQPIFQTVLEIYGPKDLRSESFKLVLK